MHSLRNTTTIRSVTLIPILTSRLDELCSGLLGGLSQFRQYEMGGASSTFAL